MPVQWLVRLNRVDLISLTGLLLAAGSMWLVSSGYPAFALGLMYLGMLADALDGHFARRWQLASEFGRYLDGFVDTFLYLVAPAVWLWHWGFNGWGAALAIAAIWVAGSLRLAVFNQIGNIENSDGKLAYLGMPVFWTLLILGPAYVLSWLIGAQAVQGLLLVIYPLAAALMLIKRPFFKFSSLRDILLITLGGALIFISDGLLSPDDLSPADLSQVDLSQVDLSQAHAGQLLSQIGAALWLTLPIVIGGVWHMLAVTRNWWPALVVPLHRGWFGANKTWRGFVAMPLFTAVGALPLWLAIPWLPAIVATPLAALNPLLLGLALGLGYMLAELPNSLIKRRLGIAPGEMPERGACWFVLADQVDSGVGFVLVYWLLTDIPPVTLLITLLLFPLVALGVKRCLFWAKLKRHSR